MRYDNHHQSIAGSREIARLIASYRESGLGLERFARQQRIPPGRLHYWLYQKDRAPKPTFSAKVREIEAAPVFQEVKLDPGSLLNQRWAAEVSLTGGLSIRFSATATPDWIGTIIQTLQRPC